MRRNTPGGTSRWKGLKAVLQPPPKLGRARPPHPIAVIGLGWAMQRADRIVDGRTRMGWLSEDRKATKHAFGWSPATGFACRCYAPN